MTLAEARPRRIGRARIHCLSTAKALIRQASQDDASRASLRMYKR
jgi:hypothetical protein